MASIFKSMLNWLRQLFFFGKELEITLVGLQNAGKTSLVHALLGKRFSDTVVPTVGFNAGQVIKGGVTIKIWDLSGQAKFRSMWERYCYGVNAILFIVDSSDESTFAAAKEELHALLKRRELAMIPLLVLGNKCDKPDSIRVRQLIEVMDLQTITDREVSCYSISAKERINLDVTLNWLINRT